MVERNSNEIPGTSDGQTRVLSCKEFRRDYSIKKATPQVRQLTQNSFKPIQFRALEIHQSSHRVYLGY